MNKKLVLAIVLGAFTLGACTITEVEVSRKKTKHGDRIITESRTDYDSQGESDSEPDYKIEYFVEEPETGRVYEVVPCPSGFCKTPKEEAQYQEDLAALDKKNDSARRKTGGRGIVNIIPEDEVDYGGDGGGGG